MLKNIFKYKWMLLAIICFLLSYILPATFIEAYYSNGFYIYIRKFFDTLFGKLPFPAYYLFLLFLFFSFLKWMSHFYKEEYESIQHNVFRLFSFVSFILTSFYILWGFNYGRVSIDQKLKINYIPLSTEQLISEYGITIQELIMIRTKIQTDTNTIPQVVFINNIEPNCRVALNKALKNFNYPYSTKIRGRFVFDDMFLRFGIGGQYLPFVGEANVDDAIYYSKKPFYLIHEMAHGNGFAEEATCNFIAYISCVSSGKLALQYSGKLNYLFYLISEIRDTNFDEYENLELNMPVVVKKDILEIRNYNKLHTFKTSKIGDEVNNYFLKVMGVKDGVVNYNKMIQLVYAWKNSAIHSEIPL